MTACEVMEELIDEEMVSLNIVRRQMLGASEQQFFDELRSLGNLRTERARLTTERSALNEVESDYFDRCVSESRERLSSLSPEEMGKQLCSPTAERHLLNRALTLLLDADERALDPAHRPEAIGDWATATALQDFLYGRCDPDKKKDALRVKVRKY